MRIQQTQLKDEGIIYCGLWEPIYFIKQLGYATENVNSYYDFVRSEEFISNMRKIGINQLWYNFFKGYGLKFEAKEHKKIRKTVKLCHRYNIRTVAYCTFGSFVPETLRYEEKNIDNWISRTEYGLPGSYGCQYQCFRVKPCYSSPSYLKYMKKVVDKALEHGFDIIHFDNTNTLPEPGGCKCKRCLKLWREFLNKKYKISNESRIVGMERWGRNDFKYAVPPWYDQWNIAVLQREVSVANQQDWFLFRQEIFSKAMLELARYIHKKGKAVEFNMGKHPGSAYRIYGSINEEEIFPEADMVFNENTCKTGYNSLGSPITRIREHKIVQNFNIPMMSYNKTTHEMAEAFSFNPGMLGMWGFEEKPAKNKTRLEFFRFYHKYKHYQTKQSSLAQVSFLLHNKSMTFSTIETYLELCCMQQCFQEKMIPFNVVYSKDLHHLERYKLLVISSMHCVTDEEAEKISEWVKKGGSLLVTGKTGTRDDYFRIRTKIKEVKNMKDLYDCKVPSNVFSELAKEDFTCDFIKKVENGKVAYIKELDYVLRPSTGTNTWMVNEEYYNLPRNYGKINNVIEKLLPVNGRNLIVNTKEDLLVDICIRDDTGEGIIHLFNISFLKGKKANAKVKFKWYEKVCSLTRIGYDILETPVRFIKRNKVAEFKINNIKESAIVIINKIKGGK